MRKAAALVAVCLFLGLGIWFLNRGASTATPEQPDAEPVSVATGTSTTTQTTVAAPTAVPAPAAPMPVETPVPFQQTLEKTQAALPTREQISKLKPSEQHKTPVALINAGTEIGKVAEAIEKDPSLAPQGIDFYGKCARRSELSTSIRALCLGNLRDLGKATGSAIDEEGVSPEIRRLADKLND